MSALRTAAFAALAAVAIDGALLAQEVKQPNRPDGKRTEIRREIQVRIGGPWLGVGIDDMDGDAKGAKITSIADSSPAAQIGLKEGDVITSFNGQPVEGAMQLRRLVMETPAGRTVNVGYTRNGAAQSASVKLAERRVFRQEFSMPDLPNLPDMADMPDMKNFSFKCDTSFSMAVVSDSNMRAICINMAPRPRLGVNTADIAPAAGKTDGRVMVTGVLEKSPAADAGLQPGDVVLDVGGKAIHTTGELQRALADRKEGPVSIRIKRDCEERTINATLKKPEASEGRLNRNGMQFFQNNGNFLFSMPQRIEIEINGDELEQSGRELEQNGQELQQRMEELRQQLQQKGGDAEFSLRRVPTPPLAPLPAAAALRDV